MPTLKGPDGTTLTLGQHYRIDYSAGNPDPYRGAAGRPAGRKRQPFGSLNGNTATGNPCPQRTDNTN